ncbi:MAG TPA: GreA/GreB family elongation factor [Longimicrobiales bacterium]|nr:GreA/GreB family elongation factor [Longimicrobiales bacterium]
MLDEIKAKLDEEIGRLIHELNFELPIAIAKAVELGDLRENADYKSALERQQFVQARLNHLVQRAGELASIDVAAVPIDRAGFGSRVTVRNTDTGDSITYTIVAGDYIDLDSGQISMASALGRALMGRKEGETFEVELPAGVRRFEVTELVTLSEMVK